MARIKSALNSFNRGEISRHALGRLDIDELRLAAETQINFMPLVLGPMTLRPGMQYLFSTRSDAAARYIPFVFGASDTALIEITNGHMRVVVDDAVVTRGSVSSTIANGSFASSASWTSTLTGNSSASFGGTGLTLAATARGGRAIVHQQVSVALADQGDEHALRITVGNGPVTFRCGTSQTDDSYIGTTSLDTGVHSLTFTPAASFYVTFESRLYRSVNVTSVAVEGAGAMDIPVSWDADDLSLLRYDQSGDIIYVACEGQQQRKIERRSTRSWSFAKYYSDTGPFKLLADRRVQIGCNAHEGNGTLSASAPLFTSAHVGSLFQITSRGQNQEIFIAGPNEFNEPHKVTGSGSLARNFDYQVQGTWAGTLALQASFESAIEGFNNHVTTTINVARTTQSESFNSLDVWWRWEFTSYTSGTAIVSIFYGGGERTGVVRVKSFSSSTSVGVEVLKPLADSTGATQTYDWRLGDWNDIDGWPSSVKVHDGRLWWAGRDKIWGSVSDDFVNYDEDFEGDAGPINRSFGYGPIANVNWMLSLQRLLVGRDMSIVSIRSSNFDAPLTPTDFTMRDCASQGSARLSPVQVDSSGIFVDQSGRRVYELRYNSDVGDYSAHDLTRLNLDIGLEGFVDVAVQRQPDTRVHFVRGDGQVAVLTYDRDDNVLAWWRIETDGDVENVVVLPGEIEDTVYYVVNRTINGSTKRYLEKFARMDECLGATLNKQADSHVVVSQASSTTITGLSHIEGETVVIWANGKDLGTKVVASGQITGLSEAVTSAIVGLSYDATFKSAKLAYGAMQGTALNQKKRIDHLGLSLIDTHYQGLEYGPDFTTMDELPLIELGTDTAAHTVWEQFDTPLVEVPGEWHSDSRLCLRASAPRPCTVLSVAIAMKTNEA